MGGSRLLGLQRTERFAPGRLKLPQINVLPQPRRTFDNIRELAGDVAERGFINPSVVARFTHTQAQAYLDVINAVWGRELTLRDLHTVREHGRPVFYILIAGERRFRSCMHLWNTGCENCLETHGQEEPGICFRRHFPDGDIEVRLILDVSALRAVCLQLAENTHRAVPPHEEAEAYALFFQMLRAADPSISIAAFARLVGRGPETIRNAIRFCELPDKVHAMVKANTLTYGMAVELWRLQQAGLPEQDLLDWAIKPAVGRLRTEEFRNLVTDFLESRSNGQLDLMALMRGGQDAEALRQRGRRLVVERRLVPEVWVLHRYLGAVLGLFESGQLGTPDGIFSEGSPVHISTAFLSRLRCAVDLLRPHMTAADRRRVDETLLALSANSAPASTDASVPPDRRTDLPPQVSLLP